jgi:hypothetical protein
VSDDNERVYLALGVFAEMGEFDIKLTTDRSPNNEHGENTIIVDEEVFHALIREAQRAGWSFGRPDEDRQSRLADWYERRELLVRRMAREAGSDNVHAWGDFTQWEKENSKP